MKKFILTLLVVTLTPNLSFALDAAVKGFIALDALNYKKIERTQDSLNIGIAVLDLKIFAEQDNMTAAMKLNIDGNLSVQNNLFEEAYATYRGFKNFKITLGKGVVKFQNLHWGVIENTYQDGGTVLESENSWRKISNKALVSLAYGNKGLGFTNTFTLWGDSQEIQFDEKGNPKFITSGGDGKTIATPKNITAYDTKAVPSFTTQKQLGLANKFELYKTQDWTFTTGQVYFKNKLQDKASYAIDFGATLDSTVWEFWADAIYGFTSKSPFESYTTYRKNEYFLQTGLQYHFDEYWSVLTNLEYLHVKDQAHTFTIFSQDGVFYTADSKLDKAGQTIVSSSYKIEVGGQYKLSKSSFITTGVLYEKKIVAKNGVNDLTFVKGVFNANAEAFQFVSSISFWF
ncbi:MAG: hypothetical protein PHY93_06635 [Bacteriovorax sp.]|nr:hypothetical protein [Bacteriovorax sp.]